MAVNVAVSPSPLRTAGPLVLLAVAAGCSSWTSSPRSTQQLSDFKETVKSVSGQGDMAGVDPRARQIEKNLGVGR
jgi:hypothetical protein